jgi:hypothetical protein
MFTDLKCTAENFILTSNHLFYKFVEREREREREREGGGSPKKSLVTLKNSPPHNTNTCILAYKKF